MLAVLSLMVMVLCLEFRILFLLFKHLTTLYQSCFAVMSMLYVDSTQKLENR